MLKVINSNIEFKVTQGTEPDKVLDGSYTKGDMTYRIVSVTDEYDKDKWEAKEFTTPTLFLSCDLNESKSGDTNTTAQDIESISSTEDLVKYCVNNNSLEKQYLAGIAFVDSKFNNTLTDFRKLYRSYRAVCLVPMQAS